MSGQVEILCGVAGSGKTAGLRELFRAELRRLREAASPGRAVWITPTNRSRRAIVRSLLDQSLSACFAPNVLTFDAFAQQLLRSSGLDILPLSAVSRRMIVRTLIDEARSEGALKYFAPIAGTSGFLDFLQAFIAELKRDETWPEEFEAASRRRGSLPKDVELALLYRRYQDRLQDLALYDAEGQFWSARSTLESGRRGTFAELSLVVVDGFADFTQPQYEILAHLAKYAGRMIVSLPLEDPLVREDLFAKSAAALEEIRQRCTVDVRTLKPTSDHSSTGAPTSIRHLANYLFCNPRGLEQQQQAPGIKMIEAAGPAGEARAIAEEIKELLLSGVAADQIVVALRSVDEEADVLEETLTAAGIPNWCERSIRLSQTPVAKVLLAVVQLELDDWPFDRLCAAMRSNYFRPRWPSLVERNAISTSVRTLRTYKLGSDRKRILDQLAELEKTEKEENKPPVRRAAAVLRSLSHAMDRIREPAEFGVWIDRLVSLFDEFGEPGTQAAANGAELESSLPESGADLDERDRDDWQRLKNVLYEAARTVSLLNRGADLSLSDFAGQLQDILQSQTFQRSGSEVGKVLILDASEVRNLDVDDLFLAGLSEASFPRSRRDDCFYTQAERRQFIRKGHDQAVASSQQQDEMLLYYSIVTRARQRLTLSYPIVGSNGQPAFPSPYVTALRELFSPTAIAPVVKHDLAPIPGRKEMLTAGDLRLVATSEVRHGGAGLFLGMAQRPEFGAAARAVVASAEMAAARFEQKGFTQFEGMLDRELCSSPLARKFPSDYQFSTTQLERYAACPFQFFLSDVLKIRPSESAEMEIDALARGNWLHEVLRSLHDPQAKAGKQKSAPGSGELAARLRELITAKLAADEGPAADPFRQALFVAERAFAERLADLYVTQWEAYFAALGEGWSDPPRPQFVELHFGDPLKTDGPPPAITAPYITFGANDAAVRVRGRIDRIDVGQQQGGPAFTVIDYKTRKGPQFQLDDVRAGVALQLAIYASAMLRSGMLEDGAALHQMVYWNLTQSGSVSALKGSSRKRLERLEPALVQELERTLHEVIPQMVARLRAGEFPVHNADANCTGYCPYSTVCRVNQVRSVEREKGKVWDLTQP